MDFGENPEAKYRCAIIDPCRTAQASRDPGGGVPSALAPPGTPPHPEPVRLLDRLRGRLRRFERPEPPAQITLDAIGYVRNAVAKPRPRGWEGVESRIELLPEHAPKLRGIDAYSHLIVVFYADLAAGAPAKPEQLTLASGNTYGVLATRSQLRPNHLGVSTVPLVGVAGTVLAVRGLDAIDGTPVLDIKPYLPAYDAVPEARIPEGA